MALLQIAEPGQFQAPHQHRLAIGIDLGTTNSLVAAVRSGKAATLPDAAGRHLLPSVVRYLPDQGRLIGDEARAAAAADPLNTIISVKRLMGRWVIHGKSSKAHWLVSSMTRRLLPAVSTCSTTRAPP